VLIAAPTVLVQAAGGAEHVLVDNVQTRSVPVHVAVPQVHPVVLSLAVPVVFAHAADKA